MQQIEELTGILAEGRDLSSILATQAAQLLASHDIAVESKKKFLNALSAKGEIAEEVAAFAATFRDLAVNPEVEEWAPQAIDVCGTGGDGAHTFNISTAVSFIVAAAGVPVLKHGNRSITSKCGSADLLEAIGIKLDASKDVIRASLDELNFCFFFAPAYHPVFKEIMPVRKAMAQEGKRSIFNLLGPLINPGRPAHQLLGVFSRRWVNPLSDALHSLGLNAGFVAYCSPEPEKSLDELSCAGINYVSGFGRLQGTTNLESLENLGLAPCNLCDLRGGDVNDNLSILSSLLGGDTQSISSGLLDSILLNAGAALWISGRAIDLPEGVALARELIESGRVLSWVKSAQDFYAKH
jgi:anthranilate phosphoribosyltransferase